MRVMSAARRAISVPDPKARPASAWAKAGASLMPSPAIATMVLEAPPPPILAPLDPTGG